MHAEVTLPAYHAAMDAAARAYWQQLLAVTNNNVPHAALISAVHRTAVYKHLQRLGIELPKRGRGKLGNRGKWHEMGL